MSVAARSYLRHVPSPPTVFRSGSSRLGDREARAHSVTDLGHAYNAAGHTDQAFAYLGHQPPSAADLRIEVLAYRVHRDVGHQFLSG